MIRSISLMVGPSVPCILSATHVSNKPHSDTDPKRAISQEVYLQNMRYFAGGPGVVHRPQMTAGSVRALFSKFESSATPHLQYIQS